MAQERVEQTTTERTVTTEKPDETGANEGDVNISVEKPEKD